MELNYFGRHKTFSIDEGNTHELRGESLAVEKSLQQVIENNAEKLLGINFLATEYTTGKTMLEE